MFNFTTICESVKRHWIAIVLITALALVAGAGSSFVKSGKVETVATYTAEAPGGGELFLRHHRLWL